MSERTLNIDDKQISFIRLIQRSPNSGDGWRIVSKALEIFAERMVAEHPELYEVALVGNQLALKLSERGEVLSNYIGTGRS